MKKLDLTQSGEAAYRDNFKKLDEEFDLAPVLNGQWRLFDIQYIASGTYSLSHGLGFSPLDLIQTYPDSGVTFSNFNKNTITITTTGAARARFLLGRMK